MDVAEEIRNFFCVDSVFMRRLLDAWYGQSIIQHFYNI